MQKPQPIGKIIQDVLKDIPNLPSRFDLIRKRNSLSKRFNTLQRIRNICIDNNYHDKKKRCEKLIRITEHQLNSLYTLPEWN